MSQVENMDEFDEIKGVVGWQEFALERLLAPTLGAMRLRQGWGHVELFGWRWRNEVRRVIGKELNKEI